jgi:glycosyltransferase involved in cell wall biosynthesis
MFQVDVLLGVKNPDEKILRFLYSLSRQDGVSIRLIISNDGCDEYLLSEVSQPQGAIDEVVIIEGDRRGPKENYRKLLSKSTSEFVAFADQDDYWFDFHLAKSCRTLLGISTVPKLSYSSVIENYVSRNFQKIWPSERFRLYERDYPVFENSARGCTIVMNRRMASIACQVKWDHSIMHDWHCLLIANLVGQVFYDENPHLIYNIHERNFTKKTFKASTLRGVNLLRLPINRWPSVRQLIAIYMSLNSEVELLKHERERLNGFDMEQWFADLHSKRTRADSTKLRISKLQDFVLRSSNSSKI